MPSSVIERFSYDAESRALIVVFLSGRRYRYADVPPDVAQAFATAFSKGTFFNRHIRDRYRHQELPASPQRAPA